MTSYNQSFNFRSKSGHNKSNMPYFAVRVKKSYTEEFSVISHFGSDDHSQQNFNFDPNFTATSNTTPRIPSSSANQDLVPFVRRMGSVNSSSTNGFSDNAMKKLTLLIPTTANHSKRFFVDLDEKPPNFNNKYASTTFGRQNRAPLALTWHENPDSISISGHHEPTKPSASSQLQGNVIYGSDTNALTNILMSRGYQNTRNSKTPSPLSFGQKYLPNVDINNSENLEHLSRKALISTQPEIVHLKNDVVNANQHRTKLEIDFFHESLPQNEGNTFEEDHAVPDFNVSPNEEYEETLSLPRGKQCDFLDPVFINRNFPLNSPLQPKVRNLNDQAMSDEYIKRTIYRDYKEQLNIRCDQAVSKQFSEVVQGGPSEKNNTTVDNENENNLKNGTTHRLNNIWQLSSQIQDPMLDYDSDSSSYTSNNTRNDPFSHEDLVTFESHNRVACNANPSPQLRVSDIFCTQAFSPSLTDNRSLLNSQTEVLRANQPPTSANVISGGKSSSRTDKFNQNMSTIITGQDVFLCPSYQLGFGYFIPISPPSTQELLSGEDKNSEIILIPTTPPKVAQEIDVPGSDIEPNFASWVKDDQNMAHIEDEIIRYDINNDSRCSLVNDSYQDTAFMPEANEESRKVKPRNEAGLSDDRAVPDILESYIKSPSEAPFNDQNTSEEFYPNNNLLKAVKNTSQEQQRHRPIRVGLSKRHKVNPLHNYYIHKRHT